MNLNIFSPGSAVGNAFEHPNILLAIIVIAVSALSGLIASVLLGIPVDTLYVVQNAVFASIARLAVILLPLIIISAAFRRTLGNIAGLFSSISLLFAVNLVNSVAVSLGVRLSVSRDVILAIGNALAGKTDIVSIANQLQLSNAISFPGLFITGIISVLLAVLGILVLFKSIRSYLGFSRLFSVILLLAISFILYALGA